MTLETTVPPLEGPQTTREADQWSVESWLQINSTDPDAEDARALFRASVGGEFGLNIEAVSLLHFLFLLQTYGGIFTNITGSGEGQAQQFRVAAPGAQQMALIIAQRLGPGRVRVNSPVTAIEQDNQGVTVRTSTVVVRARRVIVAVPTTLDGFIRYDPILPPNRAQLQQRFPLGSIWKIFTIYDRAFWRDQGRTGESVSIFPGDFVVNARDGSGPKGQDEPGLLLSFVGGNKARILAEMSRADRKATILNELAYRYGPLGAQLSPTIRFPAVPPQNPLPDAYFEYNWSIEEFARGDFAAAPGPGVYTGVGFGPALRAPFRRIHWASVDSATLTYQSISGAVQSGKRAAAEVLATL